ncbi:MAG: DEAD/DEAH box helicase [Desulforhabdus sp.]|jgi:SNF2 family DNA or RNA helicase|nr:DEAD/DEAH box helicase [Desulforhabdus sp.]
MGTPGVVAPGARVVIRDAEWLVRKVDRTSTGGQALTVVGITELVKDKEAIFLDEIDKDIEVLDPVDTKLVPDPSSSYQKSLLYMESLLRQTPPTDDNLYIGHKAAMDMVPYQLDPAIQALEQPRQRILIADAVGLGKTLACGILVSELIRRGRGKRILVLAVKSMLTQFQKEMWSRFTIPLVRLDSIGIQRVRSRIPTNHNPFYYYDKAIISIDTLKQDAEYRTYLENAYWDIIVIDEAHNVAERGKGSSMRAKLAKLLSGRSDTLIMLSATPHDGKARSFASLMNMLDPTAIANPDDYGPEDIKGLFIRRFKKDIQDQVEKAFKKREISKAYCHASEEEELAFDVFADLKFQKLDQRKGAGQLFKTTLEKALFSSPAACLATIKNRISRLQKNADHDDLMDIASLEELAVAVEMIIPAAFSKYQKLLSVIADKQHGFGWSGRDKDDRLVIFTERIETLKFLQANLQKDLGLKDNQVEILHGGLPDVEQQRIVEDFGKEEASVRLLIASDVASEGINLHYLSHRLIHFDIPWSLMVFQQRNGRIDRYGQEKTPYILYLVNQSGNTKIKGDMRILELLIKKDDEAVRNIGDPSALMGVYDIDEEEKITADAIEQGKSDVEFEESLDTKAAAAFDPLKLLMGGTPPQSGKKSHEKIRSMPSLYKDDFHYLKEAIGYLKQTEILQADFEDREKRLILTATKDLKRRLRYTLPREVWPDDDTFVLSADADDIQEEIKRSRKDENAWPRKHYLWQHNPVLTWINDKVIAGFGRHEAPVLALQGILQPQEKIFILSGLIPNRKGHPLIHRWFGVTFQGSQFRQIEEFDMLINRTGIGKNRVPNPLKEIDIDSLRTLLPETVKQAKQYMSDKRTSFEDIINEKLNEQLLALERLKDKQYKQLELFYIEKTQLSKKEQEKREIDRKFDEFIEWVEDTMTTEDNPFIQVIAVLTGVE